MRRLFESQEHVDYGTIRGIEYDTIESYRNRFLDYFNNKKEYYGKGNYFLESLIDDVNAAKPEEKKEMLKVLFEKSVCEYIFQQAMLISKMKQGKN